MSSRPLAGNDAVRPKPIHQPWPSGFPWLERPAARVLLLVSFVALGGGLWWGLRGKGAFVRPRAEAQPKPQLESALAAVQQRLKEDPQDLRALVEAGILHFEKGKEFYPESVNFFEEARNLGALDPRIFYCLGIMYQELGLYPYALTEYRRFLRNHPEDKEIRMMTAKLLYRQGNFAEAVSEFERLKFQNPGDKLIEENLGLSLWNAKEVDRAAELFGQLRSGGGPVAPRAAVYLGQIALAKGDAKAAVESLQKGLAGAGEELGLPLESAYASLASAYQKLGMAPEAREAWQQVLKLVPKDPKAQASLRELNRKFPVKKLAKK